MSTRGSRSDFCAGGFDDGSAARTIDRLIEIPGATLERGDDVADIETFRARLQTRHQRALASPALGAVSQFLVSAQLLFPTLGALDAQRIGRLADHRVHNGVAAAEAKNVVNPLVFAPFHRLVAAIVAVAAYHDGHLRPVLSDASDDMLEDSADLLARRRLARAQDHCHRLAARPLIDVDRKETALFLRQTDGRSNGSAISSFMTGSALLTRLLIR